jgi:hypothetical protein
MCTTLSLFTFACAGALDVTTDCNLPQVSAEIGNETVPELFSRWQDCHSKSTRLDAKSQESAFVAFKQNLALIFDSNAREVTAGGSLRLGLNEFSGMSAAEFAAARLMTPGGNSPLLRSHKDNGKLPKYGPLKFPNASSASGSDGCDWSWAATPIKDQGQWYEKNLTCAKALR